MSAYRSVRLLGLLVEILLSVGVTASSPDLRASSAQEMNFTVEGKITQLTSSTLTLSSGENIIFRVRFDDKTEIKHKDGSAGTARDLHVGLTVSVDGDLAESGEITAHRITIREGPSK